MNDTFLNIWHWTINGLNFELFEVGGAPLTTAGLLRVIIFLTLAFWASKLFRKTIMRLASRNISLKEETAYILGRLAHYIIIALAFLLSLSSVGIKLTNLAIIAGALSVGIGFGLQSIFNNFVSGIIMLFERNVKVGDFVTLQSGVNGTIKEINVRSTLITTPDNLDILIPNSEFITAQVTNWTLRDRLIRVHIPFGVAYGTDKELVRKAGLEAAKNVDFTYWDEDKKEPLVWLINFGESSLDFELVVWVNTMGVPRPGAVKATYLWELESMLSKYNISIPFPQRDLHIVSGLDKDKSGNAAPPEENTK